MLTSFRVLGPSLSQQRCNLVVALSAALIAQATGVFLPLIARWMVNHADPAIGTGPMLLLGGGLLLGLALLRGCLRWLQQMRGERAAQGVIADVRGRMYRHLQTLSQGYFDRRAAGKVVIRFIGDANALRAWLARTVISVPADVGMFVVVAVALALIQPALLVGVVLPVIVLLPALAWINPRARGWTRQGRRIQTRLCATLTERLAHMGVIRVYNAQTGDRVQVQEMIDDIAGANVRRARLDAWSQGLSIAATTLALSAIVVFGMWLYLHGRVNHGDLLAAVWMTLLLRGPITRLTRSNIIHQRARVASERIAALLDRRGEPGWSPELHGYTGPGREIELRNVGYRNAEGNWDFSRLSHSVRGPGLVAVTDHADGAKTHFLELLLRLRRPHQGRIYLDGHDVRTLRVADLRSRIGWVDRDRRILLVTGSAEAGDDEESASFARAWRWTEALSGGRDADPAQASCMPEAPWRSDGPVPRDWRLRLAVCRALLHDPPILLLDEPAANLDDGAVRRLIDWLRATARERLVIVATNDRRVTAASDQVIRLRAGGTEPAEKQRPAGLRLIVPESQERASMS